MEQTEITFRLVTPLSSLNDDHVINKGEACVWNGLKILSDSEPIYNIEAIVFRNVKDLQFMLERVVPNHELRVVANGFQISPLQLFVSFIRPKIRLDDEVLDVFGEYDVSIHEWKATVLVYKDAISSEVIECVEVFVVLGLAVENV